MNHPKPLRSPVERCWGSGTRVGEGRPTLRCSRGPSMAALLARTFAVELPDGPQIDGSVLSRNWETRVPGLHPAERKGHAMGAGACSCRVCVADLGSAGHGPRQTARNRGTQEEKAYTRLALGDSAAVVAFRCTCSTWSNLALWNPAFGTRSSMVLIIASAAE